MKKKYFVFGVSLVVYFLFFIFANNTLAAFNCVKNDALKNILYKGAFYKDYCLGNRLIEYYCQGNIAKIKWSNCINGCTINKCNPVSSSNLAVSLDFKVKGLMGDYSDGPITISSESAITLRWSLNNAPDAAQCEALNNIHSLDWNGVRQKSGEQTLYPSVGTTTTYTLQCKNVGGNTVLQKQITVNVHFPPISPNINEPGNLSKNEKISNPNMIKLSGKKSLDINYTSGPFDYTYLDYIVAKKFNITWTVSGADSCVASGDWSGKKNAMGDLEQISPSILANDPSKMIEQIKKTLKFKLTCSNSTSIDEKELIINVYNGTYVPDGGYIENPCYDTDGIPSATGESLYYNNAGIVWFANKEYKDICLDNKKLVEYMCVNGKMSSTIYTCPGTCFNGACLTVYSNSTCFDPDGGVNLFKPSTIRIFSKAGGAQFYPDSCDDDNNLAENFCVESSGRTIILNCPYGCSGAKCMPENFSLNPLCRTSQSYAWSCSPWSVCGNRTQIRSCKPSDDCGGWWAGYYEISKLPSKPSELRNCVENKSTYFKIVSPKLYDNINIYSGLFKGLLQITWENSDLLKGDYIYAFLISRDENSAGIKNPKLLVAPTIVTQDEAGDVLLDKASKVVAYSKGVIGNKNTGILNMQVNPELPIGAYKVRIIVYNNPDKINNSYVQENVEINEIKAVSESKYFNITATSLGVCIDSDRGQNADIASATVGVDGGTHNDSCDNNLTLQEWYCDTDGSAKYVYINCPYGCDGGYCTSVFRPNMLLNFEVVGSGGSYSQGPLTINYGSNVNFKWKLIDVTGLGKCNVSNDNSSSNWSGVVQNYGQKIIYPRATTTYTLQCKNVGGNTVLQKQITVNVIKP